jgi:hypothetical protein
MKKKIGSVKLKRYELAGEVNDDMDKGKKRRKQYANVEKSVSRIDKAVQNNQPENNKNMKPLSTENKSVLWGAGSPFVNYNINTYKKPVTNDKDSLNAYNSTESLRKAADNYSGGYKNGGSVKMKKGGSVGSSKKPKMSKGGSTSFGMLSVKKGIDKNPKPTAADRIAGAKMKKGGSVKSKKK